MFRVSFRFVIIKSYAMLIIQHADCVNLNAIWILFKASGIMKLFRVYTE